METVKEKLAKLIEQAERKNPDCGIFPDILAEELVQNGVTIQEWVSVDEPPKESGHYWVNIHQEDEEKGEECDMVLDAWYQPNVLLFAPKEVGWTLMNEWHDFTDQMRNYITHWMPVPYPQPPKGVQ